jgi:Rrf2 family protein
MKISTLEDHCLRCLSQLARAEGRVTIGRIAESEGLSVENTAKVLARLREAGLIDSFRGKDGGYVLARPPESISISDVLRAVAGELFEYERCSGSEDGEPCVHEADCGIRPIWVVLGETVHGLLSSISLADLVDEDGAVEKKLGALRDTIRLPAPIRAAPPRSPGEGAPPLRPALSGLGDARASSSRAD